MSDGGSDSNKTPGCPESHGGGEDEPTKGLERAYRLMVTTGFCLVRKVSMLTPPPRLLLRIRLWRMR
uniref:Uncharacterized protein n=1 Tax=Peronospora matthiolae TaxID=2874970 RepID=A0AAV1UFF1_9STRA